MCCDFCQLSAVAGCDSTRDFRATLDNRRMHVHSAHMAPTTGPQLRLERQAAYLTVIAVAAQMGVHRNTLAAIERQSLVRPDQAQQVRDAIARLSKAAA